MILLLQIVPPQNMVMRPHDTPNTPNAKAADAVTPNAFPAELAEGVPVVLGDPPAGPTTPP